MGLEFKPFKTKRLLLRPITPRDDHAFLRIFSDPETMKYWSRGPLGSLEEAVAMVQEEITWGETDKCLNWGIARIEDGGLLGKVSLFDFDKKHRRAEIGYIIDRSYWNRGLVSEVLMPVLAYAFGEIGLHRLEADVDPANLASLALLKKFGFRREGLTRESFMVHGRWHDSVILGLLEDDYRATLKNADA
ncbi:MAG: GNAT family protein [Xanthomonadales bacterium]|nr:GNAT family protein [Xanthomonadales bacterium]